MKLTDSYKRLKARRPELEVAEAELALSEAIADLIVDARVRAGLTQAEVARRARTSQARISELERGEANPTVDTLARVAGALGGFIDLGAFLAMMESASVTNTGTFRAVPVQLSFFTSAITEGAVSAAAAFSVTVTQEEGFVLNSTEEEVVAAANSELALAA
jgi:transcriptional regulator with XRE-family HTH domain